jgi:hypothetical protein
MDTEGAVDRLCAKRRFCAAAELAIVGVQNDGEAVSVPSPAQAGSTVRIRFPPVVRPESLRIGVAEERYRVRPPLIIYENIRSAGYQGPRLIRASARPPRAHSQVRNGLAAGAKEIRTRSPTAIASSVSGPCWSISSRARATHSRDGCGVRTTLVPESNRRSPCRPPPELPSGPNPISTHGHGLARQAAGGSRPPRDRRPDRP